MPLKHHSNLDAVATSLLLECLINAAPASLYLFLQRLGGAIFSRYSRRAAGLFELRAAAILMWFKGGQFSAATRSI